LSFQNIVLQFGGHRASELGLDLDTAEGRAGWLIASALASTRTGEADEAAFAALTAAGLAQPVALARAEPRQVVELLAQASRRSAERDAALLVRIATSLAERHAGSLEQLAAGAADLPELGEALVRLAPGFGPAAALRFLRPLRSRWPAAREVPLDPAARAAALHLGWIAEGADEEGEPSALAAALQTRPDAPALWDAEAALARLGRAACRPDRPERCPLQAACPRRDEASQRRGAPLFNPGSGS
jgi:endonuclease III